MDLTGSYAETCSCELMCHATCRSTTEPPTIFVGPLVFNIKRGQIDGTDIAGRKVANYRDTPKVMTEGNWRLGVYVTTNRRRAKWTNRKVFTDSWADRWAPWLPRR